MQSSYYAIIPATVRYDSGIKQGAKLLYGEITALCNNKGFCWATNHYFAQLYDVSERTIQRWINDLNKSSYIKVELNTQKGQQTTRKIMVVDLIPVPLTKQSGEGDSNVPETGDKNVAQNSTRDNTTENKGEELYFEDPELNDKYKQWVAYRKEIKKTMKPTTIEAQIKKLIQYPKAVIISAIDKSIESGWQGLFPERQHTFAATSSGVASGVHAETNPVRSTYNPMPDA